MQKIKKFKWFFLGLVATISLLWPLFVAPYFTHHDDVQIIRLHQMHECIRDGQIPCRWVPDLGGLYGYPLFNYYAPLPYYFGEIALLVSGNLIFSAKMMFAASFVGAYIFMYLAARKLWGSELAGSLSGIFYSFAPYHAVDFYARGAMGEMWALMFFPAIFWFLLRLRERENRGDWIFLALSYALLITSHNLSAMIFTPIILAFAVLLYWRKPSMRFLLRVSLSLFFGLTLSAFYWLPALAEKNLVHVETTTVGYFSYTEHFKGFRKLLLERSWGWGPSIREIPGGERDGLSYQIGWVHLALWALALVGVFRLKKRWPKLVIIFLSLVTLVASYLINPRSIFIWNSLPPLAYLQFPWRFLLLIIFSVSLLSGSVFLLTKSKLFWFLAVAVVIAFNFSYFRPEKFLFVSQEELLTGEPWDRQIKRSIFDYLPTSAVAPPAELANKRFEVLTGEVKVRDFQEGSNWFEFQAEVASSSRIRMSVYYFPNWKIFANDQELTIDYENDLGLITFNLEKGSYGIVGQLQNTPVRTLSNLLTLGAGFVTLGLLARRKNA